MWNSILNRRLLLRKNYSAPLTILRQLQNLEEKVSGSWQIWSYNLNQLSFHTYLDIIEVKTRK